eukprot:1719488-Amphidinium_carterae.1
MPCAYPTMDVDEHTRQFESTRNSAVDAETTFRADPTLATAPEEQALLSNHVRAVGRRQKVTTYTVLQSIAAL